MAYNLSFDAAALFRDLNNQVKFAMAEALERTARTAQEDWQQSIYNQRGMYQPYKDRYALSVKYDVDKTNLTARIYSNDPMATPFETGEAARDLKRMLNTSEKVRVSKGGKHPGQRYLIIPFRHQTPSHTAHGSSMTTDVYRQAMALTKSKSTLISMRPSGLNASNARTRGPLMTMRSSYNWGGRLNGPNIPARQRGMVRMETSSGKQTSSKYFTFRVMTENSPGWIVKAKPGRFIVRGVADRAQEMLTFNVRNAIASVAGV
jgi:hypothetical protein